MSNTKKGRLIKSQNGVFTVFENNNLCECKACTRLRIEKKEPLCGDFVTFDDNGDGTGFITDIDNRKNRLFRPQISNIDVLVIVVAAANPKPDVFYIDKLTCIGVDSGAEVLLVVNKNDIESGKELYDIYSSVGFKVFMTDTVSGNGTDGLFEYLKNKTAVFAGPSGVGKSSLLNILIPENNLITGELSKKVMRGKNTTRHTELFRTKYGGFIADTPGFTSLDFEVSDIIKSEKLKEYFPEMQNFIYLCRYRNCTHTKDEGCRVIEEVKNGNIPKSRHESYIKLYEILNKRKEWD